MSDTEYVNIEYENGYAVTSVFDEIGLQISNCVSTDQDYLPLLNSKDELKINKNLCPLCGGSLTPMGWFRKSGIKEMLHKYETCGLAVFREI